MTRPFEIQSSAINLHLQRNPMLNKQCSVRGSYDEDKILTAYVWRYYYHLFTEFERKVAARIILEMKTRNRPPDFYMDPDYARWLAERDEAVMKALEDGHAAFQRRVRDRILAEDGDQVSINRCPVSRRIVRTPKAKQCQWCCHDWHTTT